MTKLLQSDVNAIMDFWKFKYEKTQSLLLYLGTVFCTVVHCCLDWGLHTCLFTTTGTCFSTVVHSFRLIGLHVSFVTGLHTFLSPQGGFL